MKYELTVSRKVDLTEEEIERDRRNGYGYGNLPQPSLQCRVDRVLTVELSDEEFLQVKKAVIAVYE